MKISGRLLAVSILVLLLMASPCLAQKQGQQMGQGMMGQGMMHGAYGQFDSRFNGFSDMTLSQMSNNFGVPVGTIASDSGLPGDIDPNLTMAQIEHQYGVSEDQMANYMVLHMRTVPSSINARDRVLMRQQAMSGLRSHGMVHGLHFMTQGRSAYGDYTTFTFEGGEVMDFAVSGDVIFDSVSVEDFDYISENIQGSMAVYLGDTSQIYIHDNPMSAIQVRALDDAQVVFDLEDGVEAEIFEDNVNGAYLVKITKDNFEGYLITCSDCLVDGSDLAEVDVKLDDSGKITVDLVEGSMVMFRATPMAPEFHQTMFQYSNNFSYMHQRIGLGIALGHVGAEVAIRERGNTASLMNYTRVNVRIRESVQNRVVMDVSSELDESQIVTIDLDNETIDLTQPDRLRLRYDGEVLRCADNIDELFDGGEQPLCYMLQDNDTVSMAVYIPSFSEHEIIIDLEPEDSEDGVEDDGEGDGEAVPGFEALIAAAVIGAEYYRRRS